MNLIDRISGSVLNNEGGNAPIALLRDFSKLIATRGKGCLLIAAALTGTDGTADEWTIHREQLRAE